MVTTPKSSSDHDQDDFQAVTSTQMPRFTIDDGSVAVTDTTSEVAVNTSATVHANSSTSPEVSQDETTAVESDSQASALSSQQQAIIPDTACEPKTTTQEATKQTQQNSQSQQQSENKRQDSQSQQQSYNHQQNSQSQQQSPPDPNASNFQNRYQDRSRYVFVGNDIYFASMEVAIRYAMSKAYVGWWRNFYNHLFRDCFRYQGVESRADYWRFILMQLIGQILLAIVMFALLTPLFINSSFQVYHEGFKAEIADLSPLNYFFIFIDGLLIFIWWIWGFFAILAANSRRLHDRNMSGWWQLLNFIPYVGNIVLIVLLILDSQYFYNRYAVDDEAYFLELKIRKSY